MSVNEKMTAIADAIRSKTGGTEKLGLDAMASSIDEVYDKGYDDGVAVYEEDYTNVVPNATEPKSDQIFNGIGYKNDWRQNNDGSGYASSGKVSIGLINYIVPNSGLPSTIYIKGNVSLDGAIVQLWKANKVYVTELYSLAPYFTITEIKNGYFKLVPIAGSNGRSPLVDNCGAGISYFSFILNGNGDNLIISLDDPISSVVENAYANGQQAEYDAFWDAYQENGNRQSYDLAFGGVGWSNGNIFKPKYKIYPTRAYRMFESSTLTDLSKVDMDFSRCSYFVQAFTGSSVTKLGVIDTRGASYAGFLLDSAKQLVSVEKVILKDNGSQTLASSFTNLDALQNITFDGVIGDNVSFQHSGSLSKASVQNIIDHLKSGVAKTVTFHANVKAMVEADNELLGKITSKNWTLA